MSEVNIFLKVMSVPFIGLGSVLLILMLRTIIFAKKSLRWPHVPGKILSVDVMYRSHPSGGDEGSGSSQPKGSYEPKVEYEYFIGGTRYTGDTIDFSRGTESKRDKAQRRIVGYEEGNEVNVYYDPSKPERSVLEPGVHGMQHVLFTVISVLFFAVGAGFLIGSSFA